MNANRLRRGRRRGYGLVELATAAFLLMAAMGVTAEALGWVARERRAADRRAWAVQAASNALERLAAEPFDRVTADRARAVTEEAGASRVWPGATWEVAVEDEPDAPVPARRVTLGLRRGGPPAEGRDAPVRLSAWVFGTRRPR